jgi:molybdopterin molybdotransferase
VISFADARAHVLAGCAAMPPVRVPLSEALGAVLVEPVSAAGDVPPFANSAMDGFAVRAADTVGASEDAPVEVAVVGTVRAGMSGLGSPVGPGEAARIMTGAPMPPGADAVVMVERTRDAGGGRVAVQVEVAAGLHVRPAGDDVRDGDVVAAVGTVLSAGHLGLLATVGATHVVVVDRPRVGVLSTGDELVDGGGPLEPGQIRDSNRISLLALVRASGFDAVDLGLVADDEDAIEQAIRAAASGCDALVTSGGVSMGDFDYVKVVLDRIGSMRWMQVSIKPAKPLAFGTVDGPHDRPVPVFGLPGNPVSSMVSFELFCRPGLRRMAGRADADLDRPSVVAIVDEVLGRRPDGKVHFARVRCRFDPADGRFHVASAGAQGSHHLSAMAGADALAELPDGPALEPGSTVSVRLLDTALGL